MLSAHWNAEYMCVGRFMSQKQRACWCHGIVAVFHISGHGDHDGHGGYMDMKDRILVPLSELRITFPINSHPSH